MVKVYHRKNESLWYSIDFDTEWPIKKKSTTTNKRQQISLNAPQPRTRTSIASDADHQRVFTPNGGNVNSAYESDTEQYGAPPSVRSAMRYRSTEDNVIYKP